MPRKNTRCRNCYRRWEDTALDPIKDFSIRVKPDARPQPVGQCPHCGDLCFVYQAVPFTTTRTDAVMQGDEFICKARSHTMAKRIANALNGYTPTREGT